MDSKVVVPVDGQKSHSIQTVSWWFLTPQSFPILKVMALGLM